jgi:hypothetical protein
MQTLRAILPSADGLGMDQIDSAAARAGCKLEWTRLPRWEDLGDSQILRTVFGSDVIRGRDGGILIPALCFWGKHLPFVVRQDCIIPFVEQFLVQHHEAFFNGDTVILLPSNRAVYLFHHEGLCARLRR